MAKSGQVDARKSGVGRNRSYRRWVFQALALIVVLAALHTFQTRDLVEGKAPEFSVRLLDGERVNLSDYQGRPLLLQFWASWCPVCRLETSSLDALARDYAVLTVALEDVTPAYIREWLTERGADFPVVLDPHGDIAALYGVSGVPTSIVIDAAGRIRFVEVGYTTEVGLRFRLWWVDKDDENHTTG